MKSDDNGCRVTWRLVIGDEDETHRAVMKKHNDGEIVYLWNNTLQIFWISPKIHYAYEIDLDITSCEYGGWLGHIAEKNWATEDMIRGIANAARKIGRLLGREDICRCFSEQSEETAVSIMARKLEGAK